VTTTQPRNLDAEGRQVLMELRDWITETYGDRAIDFWTGFADGEGGQDPTYDSGDGLHYDDEAHRIFFERVRDAGVLETVMADMEVD
jgi:lysophospholipase L1-like esterase